jgi:hypothetical protein
VYIYCSKDAAGGGGDNSAAADGTHAASMHG